MGKILRLMEQWDVPNNEYWIGVEPLSAQTNFLGQRILLGTPCKTVGDLEKLASEIQADLADLIAEARIKIPSHNPKTVQDIDSDPGSVEFAAHR
jgi:hypothetical protein